MHGHDIANPTDTRSRAAAPLEDPRRRGLELVRYRRAEVQDGRLTVELGPAWAAWFADPARNVIGVLQYR